MIGCTAAYTILAPGTHVRHANPELSGWHGEIMPADYTDCWHHGSDVHVIWRILTDGIGRGVRVSGWYSAAAIIPEVAA